VSSTRTGALRPAANAGFRYFHHSQPRLSSNSTGHEHEKDESKLTFSQRLKHLIKSYGWYALGVYFLISTIDFGVAFAAVNLIGAEHVSRVATSAKESVYGIFKLATTGAREGRDGQGGRRNPKPVVGRDCMR
jgi:hypothetical protein